jgi:ribosomal protein L39E
VKPSPHIPIYARAVFDALHFSSPRFDALASLTDPDWRQLIHFCHRTQLAIPFALRCRDRLPIWVADRFDKDVVNNAERWRRTKATYQKINSALQGEGFDFIMLKGFTHAPAFVADPRLRAQYDLDLLFPPDKVQAAFHLAR